MFFACRCCSFFFFFNDTATTEIYTLSLHDALPISSGIATMAVRGVISSFTGRSAKASTPDTTTISSAEASASADEMVVRSEEHTSELQSRLHLVCRLLLEKKKKLRQPTRS